MAKQGTKKRTRAKALEVTIEGDPKMVERVSARLGKDLSGLLKADAGASDRAISSMTDGVAPEAVQHPRHYGGARDPYEAIKVIEAWGVGFNVGSALKYIRRAGQKPGESTIVDLDKARFYIEREIQLIRGDRPAETVRGRVGVFEHLEARVVEAEKAAREVTESTGRVVDRLSAENEKLRAALRRAQRKGARR